jgi:hypothetical protein
MSVAENISIEDEMRALMDNPAVDPAKAAPELEAANDEAAQEVTSPDSRKRDETGKFAKAETKPETQPETPATPETPAAPKVDIPQGVPPAIKAKWETLDPEVRAALVKREEDVHKMFTRHDSELNLGRKMKDVIQPYMPIIQAEGGTPETAVQSLLNTAYVLRTAPAAQKTQLFAQLAQQYGVDLSQIGATPQSQPDGGAYQFQQQLAQLQQQLNPDAIMSRLREQMETDKVQDEVRAFAANPANAHFETVRAEMAALMQSGRAKDLQEAYDAACWANSEIRSTLMAKQEAEKEAKRKAEIETKKRAATSVTGSSGKASSTVADKPKSLEDELRELMSAQEGGL